jgi:hypothetical protein
LPSGQILIRDEFQATEKPAVVRWAMVTPAEVTIVNDKHARLQQQGKTMALTVLTDAKTRLTTYSTEPKADYDAPNPGTRLVGFEISLLAGKKASTTVVLTPPGARAGAAPDVKTLANW